MTHLRLNLVRLAVLIQVILAAGAIARAEERQSRDLVRKGADLAARNGCGGCHAIPGIAGADGEVGPPLGGMGRRIFIAGMLNNTPENMELWLRDPQRIVPGNAMPSMNLSDNDARAIAAYVESLK